MWSFGKIWLKIENCLLATLVAHNLKLFSDTTTFLALGRIGTQSYPVSWTELKGQSRMMGCVFLFLLKLQGLSTSVEPWCPHPFTHEPSRHNVNHPWFMTPLKWRPFLEKRVCQGSESIITSHGILMDCPFLPGTHDVMRGHINTLRVWGSLQPTSGEGRRCS